MTTAIRLIAALALSMPWIAACGPGQEYFTSTRQTRLPDGSCPAWPIREGFVKDVFVDGGYGLTPLMPKVIEHLCLEADALLLGEPGGDATTEEMIAEQNAVLAGNPDDLNGVLLYPDGAPRYRAIFANGGVATNHGESLGQEGRARFLTFYQNGGSYTGSCAGAYLATSGRASNHNAPYFGLWPGIVQGSRVGAQYHGVLFDNIDHPLVQKYPSLSEDGVVKNVIYMGGPLFGGQYGSIPPGTELIGRVDVSGYFIGYLHYQSPDSTKSWDASTNIIAYKQDENSGRLVLNSSHPEYAEEGEVLDFMAAAMQYTLEGARSLPALKGTLQSDVPMEAQPVGDRQYHRWLLELPEGVGRLVISLENPSQDVDLYLNHACPANRLQSQYQAEGLSEEMVVDQPAPGQWHLSVYGNHDFANGVDYLLAARWE